MAVLRYGWTNSVIAKWPNLFPYEVVCTFGQQMDERCHFRCPDSLGIEVFGDRKWHGCREVSVENVAKLVVLSFVRGMGIDKSNLDELHRSGKGIERESMFLVPDGLSELKMKTTLLGGCDV